MKIAYYHDTTGGYHGVTDESPDGFAHVIYAGKGPNTPAPWTNIHDIVERAYSVSTLRKWTLVEPDDVPDEWFNAIGYEKREPVAPEPDVVFEIKDGDRVEGLAEIVRKLEAGYVLAEPEPQPEEPEEPEETKLEILPGINGLVQDPLFWPLAIAVFVILSLLFKGCV